MTTARILAVDDNQDSLYALERILVHGGYAVIPTTSGKKALEAARTGSPDLILLDVMMPEMSGTEVLRQIKSDPQLKFIPTLLVTAKDTLEEIVRGLDAGADDYICKPFRPEELLARVRAALRLKRLYQELRESKEREGILLSELKSRYDFSKIIGKSAAMTRTLALVERFVESDLPVLITGPSGTGKELVARAIHFNSTRSPRSFVAQNCAAFSENLLESELFGHLRGAFTGALRDKKGLFEAADQGTLFLDEVGEMSGTLQAKLLRVLQEGVFLPVGSTAEKKVDVRVLAATNRDLAALVEQGKFREDLYYRLNVLAVEMPPLAERREDIPLLVEHFLSRAGSGRQKGIAPAALEALQEHQWRGNVRELQNEIERALVLSGPGETIEPEHLSAALTARPNRGTSGRHTAGTDFYAAVSALESRLIQEALARNNGNKSLAAKEIGISRSNLINKVRQYGLEKPDSEGD